MSERLIFVPNKPRQRVEEFFGANDNFVVISLVGLGDDACISELIRLPLGKRDRESLDRLIDHSAHDRGDCRRVDPAR